jgi:hypothetical protein
LASSVLDGEGVVACVHPGRQIFNAAALIVQERMLDPVEARVTAVQARRELTLDGLHICCAGHGPSHHVGQALNGGDGVFCQRP